MKPNQRFSRTFCAIVASVAAASAFTAITPSACADEHLWSYTRGAETLPDGKADIYQFVTLRTGKNAGRYRAWDFDTEIEYGITDKFQIGVAAVQHFFHIRNNTELADADQYRFGGVELSAKYNVLSPFKDGIGFAIRPEFAYLGHDDVAGLKQQEILGGLTFIVQKNFLDDTLILAANGGVEFAWGKKPAEEYDYELSYEAALGASYRFAPGWFLGVEGRLRSEYPEFDGHFQEHSVLYVGPSLHYGAQRWWATLSWGYQVWGYEFEEVVKNKAYAEEARNEYRFKVGFNF